MRYEWWGNTLLNEDMNSLRQYYNTRKQLVFYFTLATDVACCTV
jgi:hypothetical protein